MHNATGTGRGGEGQEAVVEAVFRLPHDPLSFMSFYASVSVCVCVCSVCTHHLVWFAKHSRGKKLRQRESERGGGGEETLQRNGSCSGRRQKDNLRQERLTVAPAALETLLITLCQPQPGQTAAKRRQSRRRRRSSSEIEKRRKAEARQTLKVKNYAESQAAATTTAAQPEL